ncbi:MAG: hypothetical protein M9955_13035 [Rhizobiaceae bacterium]|nr:hypothetical protein [Rhizobiaceae bacterium]
MEFELPMFPKGVQDVYFNDLVVINLTEQGCAAFRKASLSWHPSTRDGIISGLQGINAGDTASVVKRLYGQVDTSVDDECERERQALSRRENIQKLNENLLWSSSAFVWTTEYERDSVLALIMEKQAHNKDRSK